ncbi:MAG: diguanylate cyclase [Proteobacteria bacterium]|nr:diguanylate cyclase [Pseudomonadota bacterium]
MQAVHASAAAYIRRLAGARLHALLAAAFILVAGLVAAGGAMRWLEAGIAGDSTEQLDRIANRIRDSIEQRFRTPVYGLRGLRATFAAGGEPSRAQFHIWVGARDLAGEFPGVRAFGYAEHVYRWTTVRFLERTRRDGAPEFAIRSQGDAPDMYVVKYIEPINDFAPILGVDIGAETVRRTAIDTAIESGEPALTGPIGLMGMGGRQVPGFLIVLAVYEGGAVPATVAERRAAARGVLYAPLIAEELVGSAASAGGGLLEFDLFDGLPDGALAPFFSYRVPGSTVPVSAAAPPVEPSFFLPVVIANRLVAVRAWPSQRWGAGLDRTTPAAAAAGIAAFAAALAFAVWLLATGRARAMALAQAMTVELRKAFDDVEESRRRAELQAMEMTALAEQLSGERQRSELAHRRLKEAIESLSDAFCLYGPDERIVMHNARYTETYGTFADLIVPGTSYEFIVRLGIERGLYPAAAGREDAFVREHVAEFRNPGAPYEARSPEGRWYRIEKKLTPTGHILSFRVDITELKAKEAALARLNVDLERLATTDPLTGVANRRALMERGQAELARLKRYGGTTAFLALDIDHFKRVNDAHGHAAGDRVLVEVARRVRACLRETDLFGRVGGEEFAVVAPNTDRAGAKLLADRLIEFVRAHPIECDGNAIAVTTSVGIAMLDPADGDLARAQGRADEALYRAKHAGRNRFEMA